jgi:antirestriction protein ArdC
MPSKPRRKQKPHDIYAEVTDRIIAALENGVALWVCPWRRDGEFKVLKDDQRGIFTAARMAQKAADDLSGGTAQGATVEDAQQHPGATG